MSVRSCGFKSRLSHHFGVLMGYGNYCDTCLNQHKEEFCKKCVDNPQIIYMASYYTPYLEVCPIKEWGCNKDPGFIKYYFPERYEKLS